MSLAEEPQIGDRRRCEQSEETHDKASASSISTKKHASGSKKVRFDLMAPVRRHSMARRLSQRLDKLRRQDRGKARKKDAVMEVQMQRNPRMSITSLRPSELERQLLGYTFLVESEDVDQQLEGTKNMRKVLSKSNVPIAEVLETGVVPRLVEFLSKDAFPALQLEAAWCITNLCTGNTEQVNVVVECGAIRPLISLLTSVDDDLRKQALWALGNIAGDGPVLRNLVLEENALPNMLLNLHPTQSIDHLRQTVWTVSNLCRGVPRPDFAIVQIAIGPLADILHCTDTEVITDAAWALSYLSDGQNNQIQAVIDSGVVPRLIEIGMGIQRESSQMLLPVLRTLGNLITGTDDQTQKVVNEGGTAFFAKCAKFERPNTLKDACWALSNLTAGTEEQIQAVLDTGIIDTLVSYLQPNHENYMRLSIRREVFWVLSNASSGASKSQMKFLVDKGCPRALLYHVEFSSDRSFEANMNRVILQGLRNVLLAGQAEVDAGRAKSNPYAAQFRQDGFYDRLQEKTNAGELNDSFPISCVIYRLLQVAFEEEQDLEDETDRASCNNDSDEEE